MQFSAMHSSPPTSYIVPPPRPRALFKHIVLMIHNSYSSGNVHCGRSEATNLPQSPTQQGLFGSVRPTNGLCAFKLSTVVVNGCLSATVRLRRDGDGILLTYYYYYYYYRIGTPTAEAPRGK